MKFRSPVSSFCAAFAAAAALFSLIESPANAQRLPSTVRPEHYTLTLAPDLNAATFAGQETIDVTLAEPARSVTLNSLDIAFQSVTVNAGGHRQTAAVSLDKDKQQATFTFPEKIPAGQAALSIAYSAILNNQLRGFYLSKTARRNYAVTQFESTDARRAFPCFDEPALKAGYDVSLTIDSADTAISNSPIESDTPGPGAGKHTLKFFTTPKMSTYLVALLVGDFQCTSGSSDGVAIRVCSTPDKVALTAYALDIAKFMLHYYNTYFGIPYPLKKLDLIALPDFEAGAMENFGAITYRETELLIDPKTSSIAAKKLVGVVVAHEMAHQWFGDLVTMQWWDNLWLNEGFATWMENKSVAVMHPEWSMDQTVATEENQTLILDAAPTTRPIRAKAETPDEIDQMFDGIAYDKAGAVLLTVENFLGPETFRNGVHNYLAAHLYANATAEDFWNAQTAVSRKPVDQIMESLVAQPGEPLLTFAQPSHGKVQVTQKRFFLSPSIEPDPKQRWTLPVCFKASPAADAPNAQACRILSPAHSKLKIPSAPLFFSNAGGKGYYRANYPPSVYAAIVAGAETALTPSERIRLIGDEWAQVRANMAPVGAFLDLAAAVKADANPEVAAAAIACLNAIFERVASTPEERAALAAWIRSTYAPQYAKLSADSERPKESDSSTTSALRAQLFRLLGDYGQDPGVIAEANRIAGKFLADPASADPTMGQAALSIAASNGDAALFDKLQKIYETSTDPEMQHVALKMLAEFKDPALVERSLDYAASRKVRNQDAAFQFVDALEITATREQAWKYIQSHWDQVQAQFTIDTGSRVVGAAGAFCSADARENVKNFFTEHKVAASDQFLKHALERIDGCIEFRSLQEPNLKQWLAAQTNP